MKAAPKGVRVTKGDEGCRSPRQRVTAPIVVSPYGAAITHHPSPYPNGDELTDPRPARWEAP